MSNAPIEIDETARQKSLRLWPGVVLVAIQWLCRLVVPAVAPEAGMYSAMGVLFAGLAIVVWWAFFSRASRSERWGGAVLMIAALIATRPVLHESIRTAGMGISFFLLAIPVSSLGLVAWAAAGRRLAFAPRLAAMVATILVASGMWTLVRTGGISGDGAQDFEWRWTRTAEERLLAEVSDEPAPIRPPAVAQAVLESTARSGFSEPAEPAEPGAVRTAETGKARQASETAVPVAGRGPVKAVAAKAEWPGFRGPQRDGVIPGVRIETDWSKSPPIELWRRPIGPGWSSFAVQGELVYTHEQRGEDEVVSCYNMITGEPVWRHRDPVRFWESHAGAGPRATPALHDGRLYSFGATGILNALDAGTGVVLWSRDAAADTSAEVPIWGFTSSPLVVDDVVLVDTGTLVAYALATGEPRWLGPTSNVSYSSPHPVTIDGVAQVVLLTGAGATSVAPADGAVLWEHSWPGSSIVQPGQAANGDLLLSATGASAGVGMRRLAVTHGAGGWTVEERWTSNGLKPYFSDFVVHDGHAYGFDGRILSSIDLEDGKRRWKGGRYGHGQLIALPDQDVLLVVSEKGELALVGATPEEFVELARYPALASKTWTHPVLVGDVLLVRNDQEMAAFRLAVADS